MRIISILFLIVFSVFAGCEKDNGIYDGDGNIVDNTCRDGDQRCEGTQPQSCVDGNWSNTLDGSPLADCKTYGDDYYCSAFVESGEKVAKCVEKENGGDDNQNPDKDDDVTVDNDNDINDDNNNDDNNEIPDGDYECGNGKVEPGEVCDGGVIDCDKADKSFKTGLAECKSDCSGWITEECSEGKEEGVFGLVKAVGAKFSYIRGTATSQQDETGVLFAHVFHGFYGSEILAMEKGVSIAVMNDETTLMIRDVSMIDNNISGPFVYLQMELPIESGYIDVGVGEDKNNLFITDIKGSGISCIYGVGVGKMLIDAGDGLTEVGTLGREYKLEIKGSVNIYHPGNVPPYGGDITDMLDYPSCF
jgi:hypothetical protein